MPIQKQIKEVHGYDQPILFFKEHPEIAYSICMQMEDKLKMAYIILRQSMDDIAKYTEDREKQHRCTLEAKEETIAQLKDTHKARIQDKEETIAQLKDTHKARIQDKEETIAQLKDTHNSQIQSKEETIEAKSTLIAQLQDKHDTLIRAKDECMECLRSQHTAEQHELKSLLSRANTEVLKLAHSLSVRGMIEKIEVQYSDIRRREGSLASRKAVWTEIFDQNEHLQRAVIATCTGRNIQSKVNMAIQAISEIYRRVSDEIHHAGYDEIPIRIANYHGQELSILRNLSAAANYLIKEIE